MKIDSFSLRVILDSKNKETLEAKMQSDSEQVLASFPAGESTGKNEAKVINPKTALEKISWLETQIKGREFSALDQFDGFLNTLDGTPDKSNLGANLILSLSLAFTKLLAQKNGMQSWQLIARISGFKPSLPLCFFNVIEGGVHTQNSLPFQEYWFIPNTNSPTLALEKCLILLPRLEKKIQAKYHTVQTGAEGGYTIPSKNAEAGLVILKTIMEEVGLEGNLGLDVAASTFSESTSYNLSYFRLLSQKYPLLAIEDPYAEEDWENFPQITAELGSKVWIIGDDLTTTNPKFIQKAAEKSAVNAVIIKTTQIGTVTETIQAASLAKSYGWKIIVANRGEETMDDFIADLSVGLGADGIKSGCPLQKERLVKYQRLIEIEKIWRT